MIFNDNTANTILFVKTLLHGQLTLSIL